MHMYNIIFNFFFFKMLNLNPNVNTRIYIYFFFVETCNTENVEGFPTFKLYVGDKYLAEYEGERTEKDLIKFITNSPEVKEEL